MKATGKYKTGDVEEIVFTVPVGTELLDSIYLAKQLSNEFFTKKYESQEEPEPKKMKKTEEDSEDNLE